MCEGFLSDSESLFSTCIWLGCYALKCNPGNSLASYKPNKQCLLSICDDFIDILTVHEDSS